MDYLAALFVYLGLISPQIYSWLYYSKISLHNSPKYRKLHYVFDTGGSGIMARARFWGKKGLVRAFSITQYTEQEKTPPAEMGSLQSGQRRCCVYGIIILRFSSGLLPAC